MGEGDATTRCPIAVAAESSPLDADRFELISIAAPLAEYVTATGNPLGPLPKFPAGRLDGGRTR